MSEKKVQGLTKEQKQEAKNKLKDMAMKEAGVSAEDVKKVQEMFELAKMPITLKGKDIKLGEGEVDFRKLSQENQMQMMFRYLTLNNIYLKDLCTSMIDLMKLMMVSLSKSGVEDITKAIEDIENKLRKEAQSKLN